MRAILICVLLMCSLTAQPKKKHLDHCKKDNLHHTITFTQKYEEDIRRDDSKKKKRSTKKIVQAILTLGLSLAFAACK